MSTTRADFLSHFLSHFLTLFLGWGGGGRGLREGDGPPESDPSLGAQTVPVKGPVKITFQHTTITLQHLWCAWCACAKSRAAFSVLRAVPQPSPVLYAINVFYWPLKVTANHSRSAANPRPARPSTAPSNLLRLRFFCLCVPLRPHSQTCPLCSSGTPNTTVPMRPCQTDAECNHGTCADTGRCVCAAGYAEPRCLLCIAGRDLATGCREPTAVCAPHADVRQCDATFCGTVQSNPNRTRYWPSHACHWRIAPDGLSPSRGVCLQFTRFNTELHVDLLCIRGGACVSGDTVPAPVVGPLGQPLELAFSPDDTNEYEGFEAEVHLLPCGCGRCSGHGRCLAEVCACDAGWTGPVCGRELCPGQCFLAGRCGPRGCECGSACPVARAPAVPGMQNVTLAQLGAAVRFAGRADNGTHTTFSYAVEMAHADAPFQYTLGVCLPGQRALGAATMHPDPYTGLYGVQWGFGGAVAHAAVVHVPVGCPPELAGGGDARLYEVVLPGAWLEGRVPFALRSGRTYAVGMLDGPALPTYTAAGDDCRTDVCGGAQRAALAAEDEVELFAKRERRHLVPYDRNMSCQWHISALQPCTALHLHVQTLELVQSVRSTDEVTIHAVNSSGSSLLLSCLRCMSREAWFIVDHPTAFRVSFHSDAGDYPRLVALGFRMTARAVRIGCPTSTPTPTGSATPTPAASATYTWSPPATPTAPATLTPTASATPTIISTETAPATATPRLTQTPTRSHTSSPTSFATGSATATSSAAASVTTTLSATPAATPSGTGSCTGAATPTGTAASTRTATPTATASRTVSRTGSRTASVTTSSAPTATRTPTPSLPWTVTPTATLALTPTLSPTPSPLRSPSPSGTPTRTTATVTLTTTVTGTHTHSPTATAVEHPEYVFRVEGFDTAECKFVGAKAPLATDWWGPAVGGSRVLFTSTSGPRGLLQIPLPSFRDPQSHDGLAWNQRPLSVSDLADGSIYDLEYCGEQTKNSCWRGRCRMVVKKNVCSHVLEKRSVSHIISSGRKIKLTEEFRFANRLQLFAGRGHFAVLTSGGVWLRVTLPEGHVTELGPHGGEFEPAACPFGARHILGLLEYDGCRFHAVYVADAGWTIKRKLLPHGPVTVHTRLPGQTNLCGIGVSVPLRQWVFLRNGAGLAGARAQWRTLGMCPAAVSFPTARSCPPLPCPEFLGGDCFPLQRYTKMETSGWSQYAVSYQEYAKVSSCA